MTNNKSNRELEFTISETYDLISDNSPITRGSSDYLLKVPYGASNLKMVLFRGFNPVMKKSIAQLQGMTVNISIYPSVFEYSESGKVGISPIKPGYSISNFAENVDVALGKAELKCNFAGNINDILNNINEVISSYCDNIKNRSGTFRFLNIADPSSEIYELKSSQTGENIAILDYIKEVNPENINDDKVGSVNPELAFVKIKYDEAGDEFYTENVIFRLKSLVASSNPMMLIFCAEVNFQPYDFFSVSPFRQFFNCIENLRVNNNSPYYVTHNDCISTTRNFNDVLIASKYRFEGLDLVLRCPWIKNLTSIVYINTTDSNIRMKGFAVNGNVSTIPVRLTDINNSNIETSYLTDIYSGIFVDVDFIYEGMP